MSSELVLRTSRDAVLLLTMNRPERRNAFNHQLYRALARALKDARADDGVHVVVVTGTGAGFSAGQDFSEMTEAPPADSGPHGFQTLMDELCSFDKPIVAAVNGVAVGLGMTMLLHCDVVYVAESARMRCPFVTLGVVPEAASSYLLPATIGFQRAAEVLYTAEWIDAARAVALGIAARALPDAELLDVALAKAREIAAHPPRAVRHTKQLLLATRADAVRAARAREDAAFAERIGSEENIAAITAFFQRPRG
ncbi:MAG: enoyl-CoA hydratase-related protein [Thermodesulfobacteriota bacterium]